MSSILFVLATFTAKPGHAQQVREAITRALAPTRAEQGCICYDLLVDNSNDHRFVLKEEWQSKADLNAHFLTEHFKVMVECITPLAEVEIAELNFVA
ncbi:MAG: putative quinol monooxygenase [Pseudomonas sp.]|uniref:putative quinol monooxygenase n=1 Tax=Pseudomonas sp. TaxID=306 RepID=UPI0033969BD2